jgi:hypothetical protein
VFVFKEWLATPGNVKRFRAHVAKGPRTMRALAGDMTVPRKSERNGRLL